MEKSEIDDDFMGTKEASERWNVKQDTVSRWCSEGKIKAFHDAKGSPWRIPKDEIPPKKN